jgi:hypothetical protein
MAPACRQIATLLSGYYGLLSIAGKGKREIRQLIINLLTHFQNQ